MPVKPPILQNDDFTVDFQNSTPLDVLMNDDLLNQTVQLSILDNSTGASLSIDGQNRINLATTNFYYSDLQFLYKACLEECPVVCDTAHVEVALKEANFFPSGFTPNGDGFNDELVFPQLLESNTTTEWPDNELIVFNRWGSIIYQAKPYLNDWDGTNPKNGQPLPAGTYFYILRMDIGEGEIKQRELSILR